MLLFFFFYMPFTAHQVTVPLRWGRLWGGCMQKGSAQQQTGFKIHLQHATASHTGQLKKGKEKKKEDNSLWVFWQSHRPSERWIRFLGCSVMSGLFTKARSQQPRLCPNGIHLRLVPWPQHTCGFRGSPGTRAWPPADVLHSPVPQGGRLRRDAGAGVPPQKGDRALALPASSPACTQPPSHESPSYRNLQNLSWARYGKRQNQTTTKSCQLKAPTRTAEYSSYRGSPGCCGSSFHFGAPLTYSRHL